MRKDINENDKIRLIAIYKEVENDFNNFSIKIESVKDLFSWRSKIKEGIESALANTDKQKDVAYKNKLRDKIMEDEIKDNNSLKLLYDWSKFYMKVDESKGKLRSFNNQYGLDDNDHVIKATSLLHNHLVRQGKANTKDLFDIFQIKEINLGVRYTLRTINTPYEFERIIVKEDETEAWPAPLFIVLLRAYGVTGEDLLEVGKKFEDLSNKYIEDITNNQAINQDEQKVYVNSLNG